MPFVIIGDSRHGTTPPVLMPDDGVNFIFINPSVVRLAEVKQFITVVDASLFAATIPCPCQVVEVGTVGALLDLLRNPISVLQTVGR